MRGLLLLSDPQHAQMRPECWLAEARKLNMEIQYDETAACKGPPLLSALQLKFQRLRRRCEWVCVMAEGDMAAHGLILAAQLPVDRLILLGGSVLRKRHADRRQRRLNAFARRNLSLITAEILAAGMDTRCLRRLSSSLGYHCAGLICTEDAAELWQKRESFLTAPFDALVEQAEYGK